MRILKFQFEATEDGNVLWAENDIIKVVATCKVPEGASEDYGYISLKNKIIKSIHNRNYGMVFFPYDEQEDKLADDSRADVDVDINIEGV